MATAQKDPLLAVTAGEQAAVERLVRSSSDRMDRVRRATAVLSVARGSPRRRGRPASGVARRWPS
jgi:hypothetical protein